MENAVKSETVLSPLSIAIDAALAPRVKLSADSSTVKAPLFKSRRALVNYLLGVSRGEALAIVGDDRAALVDWRKDAQPGEYPALSEVAAAVATLAIQDALDDETSKAMRASARVPTRALSLITTCDVAGIPLKRAIALGLAEGEARCDDRARADMARMAALKARARAQ